MTDAGLANWGARYGITLPQVLKLSRVIDKYAKQQEHYCNGDPHHDNRRNPKDKNRNAELWSRDSEWTALLLEALAKSFGFDKVDFGVGLYPALQKGNETCIMVPDQEDAS